MPSSDEFREICARRLADAGEVYFRPMMGDYLIYIEDRPLAAIYEDRFMLKMTESAEKELAGAEIAAPYPGGEQMFLVPDDMSDEALCNLIAKIVAETPVPKACRRFLAGR